MSGYASSKFMAAIVVAASLSTGCARPADQAVPERAGSLAQAQKKPPVLPSLDDKDAANVILYVKGERKLSLRFRKMLMVACIEWNKKPGSSLLCDSALGVAWDAVAKWSVDGKLRTECEKMIDALDIWDKYVNDLKVLTGEAADELKLILKTLCELPYDVLKDKTDKSVYVKTQKACQSWCKTATRVWENSKTTETLKELQKKKAAEKKAPMTMQSLQSSDFGAAPPDAPAPTLSFAELDPVAEPVLMSEFVEYFNLIHPGELAFSSSEYAFQEAEGLWSFVSVDAENSIVAGVVVDDVLEEPDPAVPTPPPEPLDPLPVQTSPDPLPASSPLIPSTN